MKPPPTDDADFEQVRELLRAQYAELGPKRPGWVGRLAQRFQPAPSDSEWVAHAVPELERPPPVEPPPPPAPAAAIPPPSAPQRAAVVAGPPPPAPSARAPGPGRLPEAFDKLSRLAAEFRELAHLDLAELIGTA